MKRLLLAGLLALAMVGCAEADPEVYVGEGPGDNPGNVMVFEFEVDGTPLRCLTYRDQGISCDWQAWHEVRGEEF